MGSILFYRLLCAIFLAWAVNWSLARPEADALLNAVPEMAAIGPLAGAFVGFISLSLRQGWGMVVGFANGVWAGLLAICVSGAFYTLAKMAHAANAGLITSFDRLMLVSADTVKPLIDQLANLPLLIVSLGAALIVGGVTEALHWLLVRIRRRRQRPTTV